MTAIAAVIAATSKKEKGREYTDDERKELRRLMEEAADEMMGRGRPRESKRLARKLWWQFWRS